jgi:hypothetical protein
MRTAVVKEMGLAIFQTLLTEHEQEVILGEAPTGRHTLNHISSTIGIRKSQRTHDQQLV